MHLKVWGSDLGGFGKGLILVRVHNVAYLHEYNIM